MTTSEPRWEHVSTLFASLIDATDDERERILTTQSSDEWVVSEVRSLLHANDAADGRFDDTAMSRLTPEQRAGLAPPDALVSRRRVGAYEVIRKVGEGGMGAVYEAVRADDAYHQRVAIKTIARGADSTIIAARFRRERQILAELQHPNIAVLLDGGVTDTDTPYFVMEYVEGAPIDEWCRTHRLSIAQRLDLMLQVCKAVQYAHQHLVVHRDLKPQNVLVSTESVVKLLDFGIAKLVQSTGDELQGATIVTQDGLTPMTAAYASPEQLRGESVSTSGDIYSLGVMLYELLAGVPPFPSAGRSPAQLAEVVLTEMPPLPSVACTDLAARDTGEGTRGRLARKLVGELDAIAMMAIRKEPSRRYSSVEALSEDIRRYLRGMPVAARADTMGYRVQRFITRNRWPVATTAALALVAVISGAIIARQAGVAQREAARTARISEFLQAVLGAADVSSAGGMLPRLGPRASVGALLDSALRRVPLEFADDPAVRARLYLTIGSSLISQSRMRDASVVLDSAIALTRAAYGATSDVYALALLEAGTAAMHRNQTGHARELVLQAQSALSGDDRADTELTGRAFRDLASLALIDNEYDTMVQYAQRALATETRRTSAATLSKVVALNRLSAGAMLQGRTAEADSLLRVAYIDLLAMGAGSNIEMLDVQYNRQGVAIERGRLALADSIIDDGMRLSLQTFGANSRERALFLSARSTRALATGNLPAAQSASDTAIHIIDSIPDVVTNVRVTVHFTRAAIAMHEGRWPAADSAMRIVLQDMRETPRGIQLVQALMSHGFVLSQLKRYAPADSQYARAQEVYDASGLRLVSLARVLHASRGMAYGFAGNLAAMEREFATLPAEQSTWYRNFVMKTIRDDSVTTARARRQH